MAALDVTFDCSANENFGTPRCTSVITGTLLNLCIFADSPICTATVTGNKVTSVSFGPSPIRLDSVVTGESIIELVRSNIVSWSKIGEVTNFLLDRNNDAGYRLMPWTGQVFQVKRLGKNIIVYCSDGIGMLYPVVDPMPTFGFKMLENTGLLGKNTVTGNEKVHYFINAKGDLIQFTEQETKVLGYSEYLFDLSTSGLLPIMLYDEKRLRVYMCNGIIGFIYTPNGGLGNGPSKITGIQVLNNNTIALVSPETIVYSPLLVTTDILDFGYRCDKTLSKVTISTANPTDLYVAIDYRSTVKGAWKTSAWKVLNRKGEANFWLNGLEFRIKIKSDVVVTETIDDMKITFKIDEVNVRSQ